MKVLYTHFRVFWRFFCHEILRFYYTVYVYFPCTGIRILHHAWHILGTNCIFSELWGHKALSEIQLPKLCCQIRYQVIHMPHNRASISSIKHITLARINSIIMKVISATYSTYYFHERHATNKPQKMRKFSNRYIFVRENCVRTSDGLEWIINAPC